MPDNIKQQTAYDAVKVMQVTAPATYATLRSLLTAGQLARIGSRPTSKVVIQTVSGNLNVADNADPGDDNFVVGASDAPVEFQSLNALDQVYISDGAGSVTVKLLIYVG